MTRRLAILAAALVLVPGLAAAGGAKVDYDPDVDFSGFGSWSWRSEEQKLARPAAEQTLREAVAAELASKGLTEAPVGEGELVVDFEVAIDSRFRVDELWWSPRPRGRRWVREIDVSSYPVGTLALAVVESQSDRIVWNGMISGALDTNPKKNRKKIEKAVAKLLKRFPPAS